MDGLSGSGPRVWITRSEPGARRTAVRLEERGYRAMVAPLITLQPLPFAPPVADTISALAFTSAAAVAAFAPAGAAFHQHPVFTVGEATADAARAAGFLSVRSAGGDGRALAALLAAGHPSGAGALLHPAAAVPAFDLAAALRSEGFEVRSLSVYETVPVATLPSEVVQPLADRSLCAVLVHSPAAARALARLLPSQAASTLALAALSPACAAPLAATPFVARVVASEPKEEALLDALDRLRPHAAAAGDHPPLGKPAPGR